ncbi:predicted protein [Lichtheimia corymbifera JMRC:FSU:9682]|uniref:Uncharacterized protein n=1 Tax=Lichtheimia corymbifera JMRC:FSU:9682 TaxID=1263082 RepID=A0A068S8G8_9FUNG|nr:predicted protein [Lichtheimia corymbifera JMRC:FSU:9682]
MTQASIPIQHFYRLYKIQRPQRFVTLNYGSCDSNKALIQSKNISCWLYSNETTAAHHGFSISTSIQQSALENDIRDSQHSDLATKVRVLLHDPGTRHTSSMDIHSD